MMQDALSPQVAMGGADMQQIDQRSDGEQDTALQEKLGPIIGKIEALCTLAVGAKRPIEEKWMRNLEQFNGDYASDIVEQFKLDPDRSRVFINITRAKTTGWEARLGDMLFPTDDKNWGIKETPVPHLTDAALRVAQDVADADAKAEQAVQESNALTDANADPAQIAAKQQEAAQAAGLAAEGRRVDAMIRTKLDEAKKRVAKMETEIADQLSECNYSATARTVIGDGCKLGSGVLKGPITIDRPVRRWSKADTGFGLDMETEIKPEFRRVNPWDFYPDPDVADIEDASFTFERHAVNRHKIKRMAQRLGFHMPSVRELLRQHNGATANADLSHLTRLRAMGLDASPSSPSSLYVVWEFHGYLETQDVVTVLRNFGRTELADEIERADDPFEERRIVAYLCNGRLLKLAADYPMDSGETLYSVFSFEKPEGSILGGPGIPEMMKHEQAMLNAGIRMLNDNAALAVAPQLLVDRTAVEPDDGRWKMGPRKTWKKIKVAGGSANPNDKPFEFFTVPMNAQLLSVIVDMALKFIDMVISMPMIAQGEQGQATSTLGGMSMLFNSANVVFRRVVKNWDDDVSEPAIRRAYDWNMQFNDKDEIKGDMNVEARGTSVLLVREIQSQMMMAIATNWSTHPVLGTAIKVYDAMRLTLQAMSINPNDVLVTPEEFEKRVAEAAENQQESPDAIRAQASVEVAKISAQASAADGKTRLQIANLNRETAILELAFKGDVDTKRILASLEAQRIKTASSERSLAVEAAIEQRNMDRAHAMGREPTGSGGVISMGSEAAPA